MWFPLGGKSLAMNRIVRTDDCDVWLDRIERLFLFTSPFQGEQFVVMLVVSDTNISDVEQAALSKEFVQQGCRYAVCTGFRCSSWDDSIDLAAISTDPNFNPPDDRFVMTTWHQDDQIPDVVEYFRWNTCFADFVPRHFLILFLGSNATAEEQAVEAVHRFFGKAT